MKNRLQNRIAQSSATLPTACVLTTLLWWLPQGGYSTEYLLGWLLCVLTAYVVIETVAVNALLRIRSRMISSMFLFLMAVCGFLHPISSGTIVLFCVAVSFFCLLRTYEAERPETDILHTYLFLSLGSLLWPPLLLLSVVQLWNQGVFLRSLHVRSFGAACCGVLLPYFFWAAGAFAMNDIQPFVNHVAAIIAPLTEEFQWQWAVDLAQTTNWNDFWTMFSTSMQARVLSHQPECAALLLVSVLGLTGFVHYVRSSFDDKIRVRMCHYCFMFMQVVLLLWLTLVPSYFYQLFPLLLLTTSPAAAHFIVFTRTWLTNAWFVLIVLALIAVGVCSLLLPSYYGWTLPASDLTIFNSSFIQLV